MLNRTALTISAPILLVMVSACGSSGGASNIQDTTANSTQGTAQTSTTSNTAPTVYAASVTDSPASFTTVSASQNATTKVWTMSEHTTPITVTVKYQAGADGKPATFVFQAAGAGVVGIPAMTFSPSNFTASGSALDLDGSKKLLYGAQSTESALTVEVYDPAKLANVSNTVGGFSYATLGGWSFPTATNGSAQVAGYGAFGNATSGTAIPTSGKATYSGLLVGSYLAPNATSWGRVAADANGSADFAARTLSLSTTNSLLVSGGTTGTAITSAANPNLNLTGSLTWAAGSNSLTSSSFSTATGSSVPMTGRASGKFFGGTAEELGGSYFVSGSGGTMAGAYLLKK